MQIPTEIKITVFADIDYRYEVSIGDVHRLAYIQDNTRSKIYIYFGSEEEMKAVAIAMLKAVEYS